MTKLKRTCLKVIHDYAPTSAYTNEHIETFYEEIISALEEQKIRLTLIMGDFNAKLGKRLNEEEIRIRKYGYGIRNERGTTLMNYLEERKLFAMNSIFDKKPQRKWTWIGPNGKTKNETDYILSTQKSIVADITMLKQFSIGSDHRFVEAKIQINRFFETRKRIKQTQKIDMEKLKHNTDKYKEKIKEYIRNINNLENKNVDEIDKILTNTLLAGKEIAQASSKKDNYVSQDTKELINKRKMLLKEDKINTAEYTETNQIIKKNVKED